MRNVGLQRADQRQECSADAVADVEWTEPGLERCFSEARCADAGGGV